jgi:hypothetical protein
MEGSWSGFSFEVALSFVVAEMMKMTMKSQQPRHSRRGAVMTMTMMMCDDAAQRRQRSTSSLL